MTSVGQIESHWSGAPADFPAERRGRCQGSPIYRIKSHDLLSGKKAEKTGERDKNEVSNFNVFPRSTGMLGSRSTLFPFSLLAVRLLVRLERTNALEYFTDIRVTAWHRDNSSLGITDRTVPRERRGPRVSPEIYSASCLYGYAR